MGHAVEEQTLLKKIRTLPPEKVAEVEDFVLQHVGAITAGVPTLALQVVPGSGTGGLAELVGTGTIEHSADGAFLTLTYSLPG